MMIKSKLFVLWLLLGTSALYAIDAQYRVLVKDRETGEPIKDARVRAQFHWRSKTSWGIGKTYNIEGITDEEGICIINGESDVPYSSFSATASGYYRCTGEKVRFENQSGLIFKSWEPWNSLHIVSLQKKGKQIPMYGKRLMFLSFPSEAPPWGYDLLKADWVAPYGKGEVADIVFNRTYENLGVQKDGQFLFDLYRKELIMSFPGKENGLIIKECNRYQGVRLKEAPLIGYQTDFTWFHEFRGVESGHVKNRSPEQCFYFRIRAEKNEKGEITKALYGKIVDINVFDNGFRDINFTYFINPTPNDRNLEFDGKNNLFRPNWRDPSYGLGVPE